MARTVTLGLLTTRLEQRADIENDQHFGTTEKTSLINEAITSLYDELVMAAPPHYYLTIGTPFTTVAGTASYTTALPTDFYKLSRVQVTEQNGHQRTLQTMDPDEKMVLTAPAGGDTVTLEYIPTPTALTTDGSTFDGVNGWEEMVVLEATLKVYRKKKLDVSQLMAEYADVRERVRRMSERDHGSVGGVQRASLRRGVWPWATSTLTHYRMLGARTLELYRCDPMWTSGLA